MKKLFKINGRLRKVLTLGELALFLGKSKATLRKQIERGILPEANYRTEDVTLRSGETREGSRLYTYELCIKIKEVYSQFRQGRKITDKQKALLSKYFNMERQGLNIE